MADISNFDFFPSSPVYLLPTVLNLTFPVTYFDGGVPENLLEDNTPPQITGLTPSAGTSISSVTSISFDVTDNVALRRVVVIAQFPSGRWDVVYDGDVFAPRYSSSSRTSILEGYHFTVTATQGWPESPTFRVIALDTSANETS